MKERLADCKTSAYSVYFEGPFDAEFREQYKGVIVNARGYGGYGHFAIRKPHTIWFKLPKFIKSLFPYKWIMWKNDREKMHELHFNDSDKSVSIVADMKNPSCKKLTFDKSTYMDLKEHIPEFLEIVGYVFDTVEEDGSLILKFKSRHYEIVDGKCVVPQDVTEIPDELFYGFKDLEELVLPEGLTSIGDKAFYACLNLKSVTIPASVKSIGHDAFAHCPITDFYLHSANPDDVRLEDSLGEWPFFDRITLHVPAGSEDGYRRHPFFGKLKVVRTSKCQVN